MRTLFATILIKPVFHAGGSLLESRVPKESTSVIVQFFKFLNSLSIMRSKYVDKESGVTGGSTRSVGGW